MHACRPRAACAPEPQSLPLKHWSLASPGCNVMPKPCAALRRAACGRPDPGSRRSASRGRACNSGSDSNHGAHSPIARRPPVFFFLCHAHDIKPHRRPARPPAPRGQSEQCGAAQLRLSAVVGVAMRSARVRWAARGETRDRRAHGPQRRTALHWPPGRDVEVRAGHARCFVPRPDAQGAPCPGMAAPSATLPRVSRAVARRAAAASCAQRACASRTGCPDSDHRARAALLLLSWPPACALTFLHARAVQAATQEAPAAASERKLWGGRFTGKTDPLMEKFNESLPFDRRMWAEDIRVRSSREEQQQVHQQQQHSVTLPLRSRSSRPRRAARRTPRRWQRRASSRRRRPPPSWVASAR